MLVGPAVTGRDSSGDRALRVRWAIGTRRSRPGGSGRTVTTRTWGSSEGLTPSPTTEFHHLADHRRDLAKSGRVSPNGTAEPTSRGARGRSAPGPRGHGFGWSRRPTSATQRGGDRTRASDGRAADRRIDGQEGGTAGARQVGGRQRAAQKLISAEVDQRGSRAPRTGRRGLSAVRPRATLLVCAVLFVALSLSDPFRQSWWPGRRLFRRGHRGALPTASRRAGGARTPAGPGLMGSVRRKGVSATASVACRCGLSPPAHERTAEASSPRVPAPAGVAGP